jgi:YD repeat-containing protein
LIRTPRPQYPRTRTWAKYTYDSAGNLTAVSGAKGNFQQGYDNARNQVSVTVGNGNTTKYQYERSQAAHRDRLSRRHQKSERRRRLRQPGLRHRPGRQSGSLRLRRGQSVFKPWCRSRAPNSPANTATVGCDVNVNPITVQDANWHITARSFDLVSELTGKTFISSWGNNGGNFSRRRSVCALESIIYVVLLVAVSATRDSTLKPAKSAGFALSENRANAPLAGILRSLWGTNGTHPKNGWPLNRLHLESKESANSAPACHDHGWRT